MKGDFLVYSEDFKGRVKYSSGKIINGDGYERWSDGKLVIYSNVENISNYLIKLENGLQKEDKIIYYKDLPKKIKRELNSQLSV